MTPPSSSARTYPGKPGDVYLFATCLIDQFTPQAGLDAVRLLEREGIRVHYPQAQTCCGQPAHSSGYPDEARAVALHQLNLLSQPLPVVVPSGSCGGMIRLHYPHLFADDPALHAKAIELSERVYELSEFLVHVVNFGHPLAFASTLCGACNEVCPVKIPITDILVRLRNEAQARPDSEDATLRGSGTARSTTVSAVWSVWSQVYSKQGLYKLASWFMSRGRALSPSEQGAWTRSRTPLVPAPRRLRDMLKGQSE